MNILDNFYTPDKVNTIIPEAEKKELFFSLDGFNKPYTIDGNLTVVQLFYNLLFLEPGTYPTAITMGVGIKNYYFEYMGVKDIANLQQSIQEQIKTYIPGDQIKNFAVDIVTDKGSGLKNLRITLLVGTTVANTKTYQLFFAQSKTDGRLSTQIIV